MYSCNTKLTIKFHYEDELGTQNHKPRNKKTLDTYEHT